MQILTDRFPLIAFQLQVEEFAAHERRECISLGELCLDEVDILYVVGLAELSVKVMAWLGEREYRRLIFWEEDLGVIAAFVKGGEGVLGCSQVHLHYAVDSEQWKGDVRELACRFPLRNAEVLGGGEAFRLEVLKMHMAAGSHLAEALYGYKLSKHTLMNMLHLSRSANVNQWKGKFQGVPAVICGAGPSLSEDLEAIKGLGERALVIAGGSAITALTRAGFEPHLNVAIDPNEQEVRCLEGMELKGAPLIYSFRLHPDVFSLVKSPLAYLKTDAGREFDVWVEKELGIEGESLKLNDKAFSVTTLGLSLAVELGCDPIILVGIDLAYTGGRRYAGGEVESFESLKAKARLSEDQPVWKGGLLTQLKWVVESESISEFAAMHAGTRFLNATGRGLEINGIPRVDLKEVALEKEYPLREKIAQLLQDTVLDVSSDRVAALVRRIGESVKRSMILCEQMLCELDGIDEAVHVPTPLMALVESDLSEELIFTHFLEDLGYGIDRLYGEGQETLIKKWEAYKEALESISDAVLFEFVAQGAHADA